MGSLLYLLDFNHSSMAKKVFTHQRHSGGFETPRNSLDLQIDTFQRYYPAEELPYTYQVEDRHSEKDYYYYHQNEASMKKLIDKEMLKRPNTRQNAPNIVARLMGMDILPSDLRQTQPREIKNESTGARFSNKQRTERRSGSQVSSQSNSSHSSRYDEDSDADRWNDGRKSGKPRRREHPQEEELQKFKKEFEAWQASRFTECSRVELGSINRQLLAQEALNEVKMTLTANSRRLASQRPLEPEGPMVEARSHGSGLQDHGNRMELCSAEQKKCFTLTSKISNADVSSAPPTKIVILKPGPDRMYRHEEHWTSSSGTIEERASIEDFLEEVKERLKCELQGKTIKRVPAVRGSGIETPYKEKPSDPKHIARHIAKHARESVSSKIAMNLVRSESTRSYRSEFQFNGPNSPEFINRESRKFLSERLRNVQNRQTDMDSGSSRSSDLNNERIAKRLEVAREGEEMLTGSFRHGENENYEAHREISPRNLVRSFSAPVSGTSFGKLLLEDRHIVTGAHIQRKHEAIENVSADMKKRKKDKFNLKEKVSNFKYNIGLRGRLFGRKTRSMVESRYGEQYSMKDIMSGPTVIRERHIKENSTEVPPSPASVCSSAQEDFWGPSDYLSPISTSNATPGHDNVGSQIFREISSNLNELRKQLNQLESDDQFEDRTVTEQYPVESEIIDLDLADPIEAYVRDLLVASGLYDGSPDKFLSRWNMVAKPISNSVFEEVEESYTKQVKEKENYDRKVLLDLLNEALSTVLGPTLKMSKLGRKIINSSMNPPLLGRKLLDSVWDIIRIYVYPPTDRSYYSLDGMVTRDLSSTPWSALTDDEVNGMGREIESMIMRDLIDEIAKDVR